MFLKNIYTLHFKNLKEENLEFSSKLNCFIGKNGVGKTNLLDAIHYLCFGKSFFNLSDQQNINLKKNFFLIKGIFNKKGKEELISCALKKKGKKILKVNNKICKRLTEHIGKYPLVIVSPYDRNLINEFSKIRRQFMDNVISQSDKTYLHLLLNYYKVLLQRNSLLKKIHKQNLIENYKVLDIYNYQMEEIGREIHKKRKKFIEYFKPYLQKHYQKISEKSENISLEYKSTLNTQNLYELLQKKTQKDIILEYTSVGIHKDDLELLIEGFPIKKFGSQGQQKSFLISLKLAQFDFIKKQSNIFPILLLDDIFEKLDKIRINNLITLVNEECFGQIFISDTHFKRINKIMNKINSIYKVFEVKK